MPTARMMADGALALTLETKRPDDRISINFQALPWLEATARYSITYGYFAPGTHAVGPYQEYDRSLGFKLGLTSEGRWRPKIAVGFNDIGGTLLYSGEYVVGSKRFGRFDASLGIGWGRFGSTGNVSNPFSVISGGFDRRPRFRGTGRLQFDEFFHGPAAVFGGVVYNTPIRGLQLEMEYSGDSYPKAETGHTPYKPKSQFNYGISYRPAPFVELGAAWMYGRSLALRLSLRSDLKRMDTAKLDPPPLPIAVRSSTAVSQARLINRLDEETGTPATVVRTAPAAPSTWQAAVIEGQIANSPDWSAYPVVYRKRVDAPASATPPRAGDNVRAIRIVKAQLARLSLPITRVEITGSHIIFLIDPSIRAAALDCDAIWPQLSVEGFAGVNALTIANANDGGELYRCTKFIKPARSKVAKARFESAANAPLGVTGAIAKSWWEDPSQIKRLTTATTKVFIAQGLNLESLKLTRGKATVYYANPTYQRAGAALGRAARAMTDLLPPSVEIIVLVETTDGINGASVTLSRSALERLVTAHTSAEELLAESAIEPAEPGRPSGAQYNRSHLFHLTPIFAPSLRESLFDPDNPFRFQARWRVGGTLEFAPGLFLEGVYGINIYNNFNDITRPSSSQLPHVRSDFRYYLQKGASGIDYLQLVDIKQWSPSWTTRISLGYLEEMYGGVAGQVLYHPFGARWALGASLAEAWQRNYNKLFGFRDYHVATGHLSFYYETPFNHIDLALHAGRYLAKDWGGTIELSRRFDNGAEIGAFATLTNVPYSKFGEGSFDKGIFIRIPFDFFSLFSTRQKLSVTLRPLTRDGGAMLDDGPQLWPMVRSVSYGATYRTWDDVLRTR
jgi:hypothetical protein